MSFIDNLSTEKKAALKRIPNWDDYYDEAWRRFKENLEDDIRDVCFTFRDKVFEDTVWLGGNYQCSIEFKNCYFLRSAIFRDLNVDGYFRLSQCFADQRIAFEGKQASIKGFLNVDDVSVKEFHLADGEFRIIRMNFKNESNVLIHGGSFKELTIGGEEGSSINSLNLTLNAAGGNLTVTNLRTKINMLSIVNSSNDTNVVLEDFSVNHILINKFRNGGSFKMLNITPFSTSNSYSFFEISDTYLGKAEFYSMDFRRFAEVRMLDTHLSECSFVNVIWPDNINHHINRNAALTHRYKKIKVKLEALAFTTSRLERWKLEADIDILEYNANRREIFRQLKYAYSKQGDIISEQKFHELELLAFNKSLTWKSDWPTKVILKFSYLFGRFGQDIISPIKGLFAVHTVLFLMLLFSGSLDPLHFSVTHANFHALWMAFDKFIYMMNPFRKFEEGGLNHGLLFIDLLMRIWSSYMIYNFIRASRRFIK